MSDTESGGGPTPAASNAQKQNQPARERRPAMAVLLIVVVLALVVSTISVASVAFTRTTSSKSPSTITVTGSGTAKGTPDTVNFQIGVSTVAKNAVDALSQNSARVARLITSLRSSGVAKNDLQTSDLNIYANYDNKGNITGFTASNNLNVIMHSIKGAGAAIDAGARAAGNGVQLNGLSFSISNDSTLLKKARVAAMRNAYLEASQVARAGGAQIGSILRITDQENAASPPVIYKTFAPTASGVNAVPLQAGSQSVNVQVSVVYALK
ncbi:MAG: SIMPL domain-containing protein [Acidobacteria bacterium]|nr:SIMPL domain-containing protein [Acidobacteriota bacterium]